MVDMYVLVVCDLGRTEEIASGLRKIDRVQEVHVLTGLYDIIVKLTGPSTNSLEYAYSKIRHIDGIKTTSTLVAYTKYMFQGMGHINRSLHTCIHCDLQNQQISRSFLHSELSIEMKMHRKSNRP